MDADDLLNDARQCYGLGRAAYLAGRPDEALLEYHAGLEHLLRWCLIRDGARVARALDPAQVTWRDLITYLDARYAVEAQACAFLARMTQVRDAVLAGQQPALDPLAMQGYEKLVTELYRRLFPRNASDRAVASGSGSPARPQPPSSGEPPMPDEARAAAPARGTATPAAAEAGTQEGETETRDEGLEPGIPGLGAVAAQAPGHTEPELETAEARAIAAGQRLREMRAQGLEYCPRCRNPVAATAPTCPFCAFDLTAPRRRLPVRRPGPPRGPLDRVLGPLRGRR